MKYSYKWNKLFSLFQIVWTSFIILIFYKGSVWRTAATFLGHMSPRCTTIMRWTVGFRLYLSYSIPYRSNIDFDLFLQPIRLRLRMYEYHWRAVVCTWCFKIISFRPFIHCVLWSNIPHLVPSSTFSAYSKQAPDPNGAEHFPPFGTILFC